MFGSAFDFARRIAAGNRWLVIAFAVLVGLWVTELLVERFANLWPKLATMQREIEATNARNIYTKWQNGLPSFVTPDGIDTRSSGSHPRVNDTSQELQNENYCETNSAWLIDHSTTYAFLLIVSIIIATIITAIFFAIFALPFLLIRQLLRRARRATSAS